MAANLVHSLALADEKPDSQKPIGCMTSILQLFRRCHTIRLPLKRPPAAGTPHCTNAGFDRDYPQTANEIMSLNKGSGDGQRISTTESSTPSFSSSFLSFMSSMECNKNAQPEISPFDRITFPETPSRDQTITSPRLSRKSLDLRDVVRDSMYREARVLSVKTSSNEEPVGPAMKHRDDSPRPIDLKESLRVLAMLQESSPPWYYNETREAKDHGLRHSVSNDGRELCRWSFESRDTTKPTSKLKELPRLSLDSRVGSMQGYNGQQNVVAKLMGLEALPSFSKGYDSHFTSATENDGLFLKTLKENDLNRAIRTPKSPKSSLKDRDLIMQAKDLLETRSEEQEQAYEVKSTSPSHNHRFPSQTNHVAAASTSKGFDLPILIMKPANTKGSTDNRIYKEQYPRNIHNNDRKTGKQHHGLKESMLSSMTSSLCMDVEPEPDSIKGLIFKSVNSKQDHEKSHRKLIFDAFNEILVGKLDLVGPEAPWLSSSKLAKNTLNAQKMLKELCSEIEQLQIRKLGFCIDAEEDQDSIKNILCEYLIRRSENWTDFQSEFSGVVLDVEWLIFDDLVGEIVHCEAARPRRQLLTIRQ